MKSAPRLGNSAGATGGRRGLVSDLLITAQVVTTVTSLADPTPVSDLVQVGVFLAQGQNGEAGVALAGAAIPGGFDKLARFAKNVPADKAVALLAKQQDAMAVTTAAIAKAGDNRQLAGEVADAAKLRTDPVVGVRLTEEAKEQLRESARKIWQERTGRRAIWDQLQVHHRIPLEWSHVFPDVDPNRIRNLVGMPGPAHTEMTNAWNAWRRQLNGRIPSAEEVMEKAAELDEKFVEFMQFLL